MAQITETITDIQTQVLELLDKVEAPIVDFVKQAAERLPEDRPALPFADQLPTPLEAVELGFGFAQKLLDDQHDFVKSLVQAVTGEAPKAAKPKVAKAAA